MTDKTIEALKLAEEAFWEGNEHFHGMIPKQVIALQAVREALAEQEKQVPVAKERILELAKQERVLIPGLIGFQDNLVEFARAVIKVYQEKNK